VSEQNQQRVEDHRRRDGSDEDEEGRGEGGQSRADVRQHALQARNTGERLHGTDAEPGGGGDEQRQIEPVALIRVLGFEDAKRAVVVRMLLKVEREEGAHGRHGDGKSDCRRQRDEIAGALSPAVEKYGASGQGQAVR